jgi:hypothetical protein
MIFVDFVFRVWNWHHVSEYSNYFTATLTDWRPLGSCPAGATLNAALGPLILAIRMKCKEHFHTAAILLFYITQKYC